MNFVFLLLQFLPHLPALIQTVENLHGATGTGAQKLAAAVQLVGAVEPAIGQAIGADPAEQARLEGVISTVVSVMNAAGTLVKVPAVAP